VLRQLLPPGSGATGGEIGISPLTQIFFSPSHRHQRRSGDLALPDHLVTHAGDRPHRAA